MTCSRMVVFVVLALLGLRVPVALIPGYALHGAWDLVHEVSVHLGSWSGGARQLSEIPHSRRLSVASGSQW
jgi:hypothetical protein